MKLVNSVYVVWQDLHTRMWHPVAKLTELSDGTYEFKYTNGAKEKRFVSFPRMTELNEIYKSNTLFPFFKNRLISKNRPEFKMMIEWSDIKDEEFNPIEFLGVSGGERKTDDFRIVTIPENKNGYYKVKFFVSGVKYLSEKSKEKVNSLKCGDLLHYKFDVNNKMDSDAIMLITTDDGDEVGYYPKYLNKDFHKIVDDYKKEMKIKVIKINSLAPEQYRLLCEVESEWVDEFKPFQSSEYEDYDGGYYSTTELAS